jgi:putative transposase
MSSALFYKSRAKSGGMDTSIIKRLKELEDEKKQPKNACRREY